MEPKNPAKKKNKQRSKTMIGNPRFNFKLQLLFEFDPPSIPTLLLLFISLSLYISISISLSISEGSDYIDIERCKLRVMVRDAAGNDDSLKG